MKELVSEWFYFPFLLSSSCSLFPRSIQQLNNLISYTPQDIRIAKKYRLRRKIAEGGYGAVYTGNPSLLLVLRRTTSNRKLTQKRNSPFQEPTSIQTKKSPSSSKKRLSVRLTWILKQRTIDHFPGWLGSHGFTHTRRRRKNAITTRLYLNC